MGQRIPPEQGQAPADPAAAGGGNQVTELLENLSQGIGMLSEVIGESGIAPEVAEQVAVLQQTMDGIVQMIAAGPGGQGAQPAGGQAPVEAGAGGVPASPATR